MTNQSFIVLGLMSGSSLDGLDLAICKFEMEDQNGKSALVSWEFLKTEMLPFSSEWRQLLLSYPKQTFDFHNLHFKFGAYLGNTINDFLNKSGLAVDFIASHGHTLLHDPKNNFSIQIGDGATISSITKLPVICDFRNGDMALGGQGTPLAPLADHYLLPNYDYYLNLGGIANITSLKNEGPIGYDICPANQILNVMANKLGMDYDDQGKEARKGSLNQDILNQLNQVDYFHWAPPKSLDNNWINENIIPIFNIKEVAVHDQLYTAIHFISMEIAKNIKALNQDVTQVSLLSCGGGSKNTFLMQKIKEQGNTLGLEIQIQQASDQLIDFKEAALIALMGLHRIKGQTNIFRTVTGASVDNCGGAIFDSHSKLSNNG